MRRTRYVAAAGSAVAVTGVAVLVASAFGGGGTPERASPDAAGTRTSAPANAHDPHDPRIAHDPHSSAQPPARTGTPQTPATSAAGKRTMSYYYDQWKNCPDSELTVKVQPSGDVHLPLTSSQVWRDACHRMVATLSALNPGADVSPAPSSWQHLPDPKYMAHMPGRNDPAPGDAIPSMGPAMYRIEDAKGTVVLSFHSYDFHESDPWDGATQVNMSNGLRAWLVPPKQVGANGEFGGGEFYVENAKNADAYVLLMQAPAGYTADDFKALVTNPAFEQLMAANLAEPNF